MKHSIYGTLGIYQTNHLFNRIVRILRTNIKTTWTYPKTVWYSLRYNAGEKFIIQDKNLYPYSYDLNVSELKKNEPVALSTQLLNNTLEKKYLKYARNAKTLSHFAKYTNQIDKNFQTIFDTLYKSYEYNMKNPDFDLPVAVSARLIYACTFVPKENHTVLSYILGKFMKKLEYADADSLSQVLFSLAHHGYFKPEIWNPILAELEKKFFDPEFTSVRPSLPFVFRYKEVRMISSLPELDNFGTDLFRDGYLAAFDYYYALKQVETKSLKEPKVADHIQNLEKRIPILKEKFEVYKSSLI